MYSSESMTSLLKEIPPGGRLVSKLRSDLVWQNGFEVLTKNMVHMRSKNGVMPKKHNFCH